NFTATIDWGDGTTEPAGDITLVETSGGEGVATTGTIEAEHAYADDGVYTVGVTVYDDNGGSHYDSFVVTVNNVDPTLDVGPDQTVDEGEFVSLGSNGFSLPVGHGVQDVPAVAGAAVFADPGFDHDVSPDTYDTVENFTATIDWGDGTTEPAGDITLVETSGGEGVATTGTIEAEHAYADDGVYTVGVTVYDDDGGSHYDSFVVTVNNVVPTITGITGTETVEEGTAFSLAGLGWAIEDPGFDNPLNPAVPTEVEETFTATYTVDWGDRAPPLPQDAAIVDRVSGGEGVMTVAD
ncbi:MAG: hypothetical protein GY841_16665, partial [FCB group bacterium]|nr:hypothetical protein [FCB group bacterium]